MRFSALKICLLMTATLLFASCDLEAPRRVQVSTTLGLHAPVGDIGELGEVKDLLKYTERDEIASLFYSENDDESVNVYYYVKDGYVVPLPKPNAPTENAEGPLDASNAINPGKDVRSMFLHFPLTSLNLNFTEYLKTDVEMPVINVPDKNALGVSDVPEGTPLSPYYAPPPVPIPLDAMEEWVNSINLNGNAPNDCTTVTVKGGAALYDSLQMAVPAFGIGNDSDFRSGAVAGGDLVFSADPKDKGLKPKTDPVEIYLQLTKVPAGSGTYDVEVDLKWTQAEVYPGEKGVFEGKKALPLEEFAESSDKYKIATIPSYLYIGGPFDADNSAEVGLKSETDWLVGDGADKGQGEAVVTDCSFKWNENLLSGDKYGGDLDGEAASFNLASKVSDSSGGNLELQYYIRAMNDSWIVYSDNPNGVISADMVVILPLQFNLVEDGKVKSINGENYISIMSMLDYGSGADSDLFGRDQAGDFSNLLTGIRVSGKDMKNTLFADGLFLHVYQDGVVEELVAVKAGNSFSVDIAGSPIPIPFHPEFGVCALKPHSGQAVMRIMPKVGEDVFSLWFSADVTGMVQYERDL
jgi:hypothetical protein